MKLVLPNVEMRLSLSSRQSLVNIHCIFDPKIVKQLNDRFFSKLMIKMSDRSYAASKQDLIALGRKLDRTITEDEALKLGINQFNMPVESIREVFNSDPELREHTLIGISNSSNDGASGLSKSLQFQRVDLYNIADFIFSSNPKDIEYFLGGGCDSVQKIKSMYGSLLPCICGSDAHKIDKLFEPDKERYCWIKSNPTFNGLKQILCEPESRVRICNTKPEEKESYHYISEVKFNDQRFPSQSLVLNSQLNCIIGGKSTGKSLLLHNIARAVDKSQVKEKMDSCNLKGTLELPNFEVIWGDNSVDKVEAESKHKILYIPQTYLNRISDVKEEQTEIDKIIENVLFQYKDIKDARDFLEDAIRKEKNHYNQVCINLIATSNEIDRLKNEFKEQGDAATIKQNTEELKKQQKKFAAQGSITEDEVNKHENLRNTYSRLLSEQKQIEVLKEALLQDYQLINDNVFQHIKDALQISTNCREEFIQSIIKRVDTAYKDINNYANEYWNKINSEVQSLFNNEKQNLDKSIKKEYIELEKLNKVFEANSTLNEINLKIRRNEKLLKSLDLLNQTITNEEKKYKEYRRELAGSFEIFQEQYNKFAQTVNQNTIIKKLPLKIEISIVFKNNGFSTKVENIFDKRTLRNKINLIKTDEFKFTDFDIAKREKFIDACIQGEIRTVKNENAESALREIFTDWFNIDYTVKMDNDIIQEMSPGKKALVLLKLLISLANSKFPILVDQPEDDLDNRSIFNELIPFIRQKKIERQFIIVTHNANVVLGGDAEEVIVANQNGDNSPNRNTRFEYLTGSIENDIPIDKNSKYILENRSIQQHICDVLEGGKEAFDLRKKKYRI